MKGTFGLRVQFSTLYYGKVQKTLSATTVKWIDMQYIDRRTFFFFFSLCTALILLLPADAPSSQKYRDTGEGYLLSIKFMVDQEAKGRI